MVWLIWHGMCMDVICNVVVVRYWMKLVILLPLYCGLCLVWSCHGFAPV